MNIRRKLIVAVGAGALGLPFASFAQSQSKVWRVGFLAPRKIAISESDTYYGPFRQGMRELGYVEGRNLIIEWRSAEGNNDRLPDLAAGLVNLKVDVIVAASSPAARAAQKATSTIPIVMVGIGDPVKYGFVKSLARPEGNITGMSNMQRDLRAKQMEMLLSMVPKLSRVASLVNPSNPGNIGGLETNEAAAKALGLKLVRVDAQTPQEIDHAFALMRKQKAGALLVSPDTFFQQQQDQIIQLAAKHRLPAMASYSGYVEAGGLVSYGQNQADQWRRAATYVDKIIKGAKPADLPVEQPTTFELFVNGKTAKALGLKIPHSLLILADKVIE